MGREADLRDNQFVIRSVPSFRSATKFELVLLQVTRNLWGKSMNSSGFITLEKAAPSIVFGTARDVPTQLCRLGPVGIFLAATVTLAAPANAQTASYTDLGFQGASLAISGDGSVVIGIDYRSNPNTRAFRWMSAGGEQDLGRGSHGKVD